MNANRAMQIPHRSRNQKDADRIDMLTDRIMRSAMDFAAGTNASTMKEREQWETIARTLGGVRSQVRRMMHKVDLERTA